MKFVFALGTLASLACSHSPARNCSISIADVKALSTLVHTDWSQMTTTTASRVWPTPLISEEEPVNGCGGTIILKRATNVATSCVDTLIFDQIPRDSEHCTDQLSAVTLIRSVEQGTSSQNLVSTLRPLGEGFVATPPMITASGFTQILALASGQTYSLMVDIEGEGSASRVRVLIYRNTMPTP
jgi:hypothetical protein